MFVRSGKDPNRALRVDAAEISISGKRRSRNQDAVFQQVSTLEDGHLIGLLMVCDGMGGHQAGDVASQMTIRIMQGELANLLPGIGQGVEAAPEVTMPKQDLLFGILRAAIDKANASVRAYVSEHPEIKKAGTTLALAVLYRKRVLIAHVGDSRAYILRDGALKRLTQDHSLVAELLAKGAISPEQALEHPRRNVISRALGSQEEIRPDLNALDLQPGDRILLCTDGLWGAFQREQELGELLAAQCSAAELCADLAAQANDRDGSDNISAVIALVHGES